MNNLGFDSHQFVKDLKKANMPEAQAEALVKHCGTMVNGVLSGNVATKDDVAQSEKRLEAKIDAVEKRLEARIEALKQLLEARIENSGQSLWIKLLILQVSGFVGTCSVLGLFMAFFTGHFGS